MAEQKKRNRSANSRSKSTANAPSSTRERQKRMEEKQRKSNQVKSIVLFAVALFILCLDLIPGESVWQFFRNAVFGVFGICAFIVPIIVGYIAIMFAMNEEKSVGIKCLQAVLLCALLGALVHLFSPEIQADSFGNLIKATYNRGSQISSGGVFGGIIGEPLKLLFGKVCAIIIVVILSFVFYMLVTNTSLLSLFEPIKRLNEKRRLKKEQADDFDDDDDVEERNPRRHYQEDFSSIPIKDSNVDFNYEGDSPQDDICDFPLISDQSYQSINSELEDLPVKKSGRQSAGGTAKKSAKKDDKKNTGEAKKNGTGEVSSPVIEFENNGYKFPPMQLLEYPKSIGKTDINKLHEVAKTLVDTLRSFNVETEITNISRGPAVTRFELKPAPGVKISKITNLADDIALSLAARGVRIEAPIPGKSAVGIEVPNESTSIVSLREIIESEEFIESNSKLTIALGKDIAGNIAVADIAKMPHALIAGATGSGKSVCINSIILSILYKASPNDVKLLMIDPKVVELGSYNGIPHLIVPVVTDARKAAGALGWAVNEMMNRYKMFAECGAKDLASYNAYVTDKDDMQPMSQIVIIIDELADLMMVAPNEVEDSIMRLAQMARAAGMHLIIATQRPSVDVITGTIKTNIPSRIAFATASGVDSRTILDSYGAEKLIGKGDMLFSPVGVNKPSRIQGCFVSSKEIEAVIDFIKNHQDVTYNEDVMEEIDKLATQERSPKGRAQSGDENSTVDEMLSPAIEIVISTGQASTSFLQRRLSLGYARAARLVDEMEARGIVGPSNGSKPREILITKEQYMEMKNAGDDTIV